jgi:hypothetical protein
MTQAPLDFGRDFRVSEALRNVMRALNDAVDACGLGVAAGACACRPQDLSDALATRANRYVRIDWVIAICDVSLSDHRTRILNALAEWQGLTVKGAKPLSPEERLARLEQRIASSFGAMGAQLVEENRK